MHSKSNNKLPDVFFMINDIPPVISFACLLVYASQLVIPNLSLSTLLAQLVSFSRNPSGFMENFRSLAGAFPSLSIYRT